MFNELQKCLDRKIWKKKIAMDIQRDISEIVGAIKEQANIRVFKLPYKPNIEKITEIIVYSSYHIFPVRDHGDYLEFVELLKDYTRLEISINEFDHWVKDDISRYFPVLFYNTPIMESGWVLRNDFFAKDALVFHVDNTISYLSWRRQD